MKSLQFNNLRPLILLFLVPACSSTATLHLVDGSRLEARIERSDETSLYVGGCRKRTRYNDVGKVELVELHCDSDEKPEARQVFIYENKFDLKEVRLDICADGKVDKKLVYITVDERNKLKKMRGNPEADNEMDLDTIRGAHCFKEKGFPSEGAIPRALVRDIDHPGNIQTTIGSIIAVAGWGLVITCIIYAWAACDQQDDMCPAVASFFAWYGLAFAIPSSIMGMWGWNTYSRSKDAATPPKGASVIPLAIDDGHRAYYGLGVTFSW